MSEEKLEVVSKEEYDKVVKENQEIREYNAKLESEIGLIKLELEKYKKGILPNAEDETE